MKSEGIQPDALTYAAMITAYVNADQLEEGYKLLHEMESKNIKPEISFYTNLLRGYAKIGNTKVAHDVLTKAKNTGLPLNKHIYEPLIEAHIHRKEFDEAAQLLEEMNRNGIWVSNTLQNLLQLHSLVQ